MPLPMSFLLSSDDFLETIDDSRLRSLGLQSIVFIWWWVIRFRVLRKSACVDSTRTRESHPCLYRLPQSRFYASVLLRIRGFAHSYFCTKARSRFGGSTLGHISASLNRRFREAPNHDPIARHCRGSHATAHQRPGSRC